MLLRALVVHRNRHPLENLAIRQQFAVMQSWMAPIVEMLRDTDANFDELKRRFDHAQKSYETLVDRLEGGEVEGEE